MFISKLVCLGATLNCFNKRKFEDFLCLVFCVCLCVPLSFTRCCRSHAVDHTTLFFELHIMPLCCVQWPRLDRTNTGTFDLSWHTHSQIHSLRHTLYHRSNQSVLCRFSHSFIRTWCSGFCKSAGFSCRVLMVTRSGCGRSVRPPVF